MPFAGFRSRPLSAYARLTAALVLSFATVPEAVAQTPPPATQEPAASPQLQEVVVTGSHIRGSDVAPVVNLQVIDQAQLQQSGATQMADLIKAIPANTGTELYNESGQLSGTAQFELRGLGFAST